MSLTGKNKAIYSYNNKERSGRKFMYKDFEKTKSYNSDFSKSEFIGTSLRAAQLKFCNFNETIFTEVDFIGTNLRGSDFSNSRFINCVFVSTILDKTNFNNTRFEDCYFVSTNIQCIHNFESPYCGITYLDTIPPQDEISNELIEVINNLRSNDIIRKSNTLHCKKNKINTLTIMILKKYYSETQLVDLFKKLPSLLTTQFYTISYLQKLLKKAENMLQYTCPTPYTEESRTQIHGSTD